MIKFAVDVDQTMYLPPRGTEVDAVLTVTTSSDGQIGPEAMEFAEVIIIDCSGSMASPRTKISEARHAAAAAVDSLRDGTHFAVIAGTASAEPVYPKVGMAVASASTRREAKTAVAQLHANGGTAMGAWLRLADKLLRAQPAAVRHAIMLTDGKNESETPARFAAAVEACEGHFQCDCRGIGKGWVAADLTTIASRLLGTALDVAAPAHLVEDFRDVVRRAMGKVVNEVSLRVWVPRGASVKVLKQTYPTIEDLTNRAVRVDDSTADYPTGAWGSEKRDYYVGIGGLDPIIADRPSRASRINLVAGGAELASATVLAQWTDDPGLFTEVSRKVAESTGQLDLALAIQKGTAALRADDLPTATAELGEAVRLAHQSGNQPKLDLLRRLVDVLDPAAGKVRLRADLTVHDIEVSDLRSKWTRTIERPQESDS
jgi:hypothetical protein